MNFEEWFNKYYKGVWREYDEDYKIGSQKAWDACKKEVLKILKEHTIDSETRDEKNWYYIDMSVVEEIEKL